MFELIPAHSLVKSYKKLTKQNSALKEKVDHCLKILHCDPLYPSLKSHKVMTKETGQAWSSRVTGDIRIIWNYDKIMN